VREYRHTQMAGWPVLVPAGGLILASTAVGFGQDIVYGVFLAVFLIVLLGLFFSLTVAVDDRRILLTYGVGLIRKRIPLSQIAAVERVRNKWYQGWGIRLIPGGILYNISGLQAVELIMADDTRVRIGTDEPFKLSGAIHQRIQKRRRRFEV